MAEGIDTIISEYFQETNCPKKYVLQPLTGMGSTSERKLLLLQEGDDVKRYVVKRFQIPNKPVDESRIQAMREYTALEYLKSSKGTIWKTPAPIAIIPEHATIIMEYFHGQSLNAIFWDAIKRGLLSKRHKSRLICLLQDVSHIMNDIQGIRKDTDGMPQVDETWYTSFFDEQISELGNYGYETSSIRHVYQNICHIMPEILSDNFRCFQHTDLYFNNILYNGDKYCIIDFPNSCFGTRLWDISHLLVSLEDYKLFRNVDPRLIDECKEAFSSNFNLNRTYLDVIEIMHLCFSFKLNFHLRQGVLKKVMCRNPKKFYTERLNILIQRVPI